MILFQRKCHSHIVISFGLAEVTGFRCLHLILMLKFRIFHGRITTEPINRPSRIY